jgi:hypothetical protein
VTTSILIITEHRLTESDVSAVTSVDGSAPSDLDFYVAVPLEATAGSTQSVIDNLELDVASARGEESIHLAAQQVDPADVALGAAEAVLADVVASLTAAGSAATGEVTPNHPLETVGDIVASRKIDEVVVVVEHRSLGGALHTDLAARIQRKFHVPALRVHAHDA